MPDQTDGAVEPPTDDETVARNAAAGGAWMVLGRAVVLPSGLVVSIYLARLLGPSDFGIFALAASIAIWVRLTISMFFSRTSVKLISESPDWERTAVPLVQAQFLLGLAAGLGTLLTAPLIAAALHAPELTPVLRVLSAAIPIATMANAYRSVLNGRRAFRRSALFPVVTELSRLILVLALVGAGLGLVGAALASVGAACAGLFFAWRSLRLRLWQRTAMPRREFLRYSVPLSLDTLARRLHKRMDLWVVGLLSGVEAAGYYGVARSFGSPAAVLSQALWPVLLATVSEAWARGQRDAARGVIRQSLRLALCLLPFAAMGSAAAPALVTLVFGEAYLPAAPLLAWLSFSTVAVVIVSLTAIFFAAVGRPGAAFAFSGPLLILALIGYLILVPRIGAVGAAATTTLSAWIVAAASMVGVRRWCQVSPNPGTVARVVVVSGIAYALVRAWQAPGAWIVLQLLAVCGVVVLLLFVLGEVTKRDINFIVALVKNPPSLNDVPNSEPI